MLKRLHVREYRSLLDLELRFDRASMISGANGVGKSNCYQALALVKALAVGNFAELIALEGGMESALWGGEIKGKQKSRRIILTVEHSLFEYHVEVGIDWADPKDPDPSLFILDPRIREEKLTVITRSRSWVVASRTSRQVELMDDEGQLVHHEMPLTDSESLLSQVREPARFPLVAMVRDVLSGWRFYHEFDTSSRSPLRVPQVAFWSPKLNDDGLNLTSVIRTIWESGFKQEFNEIFESAFSQMSLSIASVENRLKLSVGQRYLSRELSLQEVSDGTLRFLCLAAALLSQEKPDVIVLNEPEMSLNEEVYAALAKLVRIACSDSQIIIVTHAKPLAEALQVELEVNPISLVLDHGATSHEADSC